MHVEGSNIHTEVHLLQDWPVSVISREEFNKEKYINGQLRAKTHFFLLRLA
jgi:hypothetical protein